MENIKEILNKLWIDDDGLIASGNGDTYMTVADCDCNDLDIDDREKIKDEIVKRCNENAQMKAVLRKLIESFPEFETDEPIAGSDAVATLCGMWQEIKEAAK